MRTRLIIGLVFLGLLAAGAVFFFRHAEVSAPELPKALVFSEKNGNNALTVHVAPQHAVRSVLVTYARDVSLAGGAVKETRFEDVLTGDWYDDALSSAAQIKSGAIPEVTDATSTLTVVWPSETHRIDMADAGGSALRVLYSEILAAVSERHALTRAQGAVRYAVVDAQGARKELVIAKTATTRTAQVTVLSTVRNATERSSMFTIEKSDVRKLWNLFEKISPRGSGTRNPRAQGKYLDVGDGLFRLLTDGWKNSADAPKSIEELAQFLDSLFSRVPATGEPTINGGNIEVKTK